MYVVKIKQYYFSKLIVCHLCGLFSCYVCFIYWYIYMFYFQLAILLSDEYPVVLSALHFIYFTRCANSYSQIIYKENIHYIIVSRRWACPINRHEDWQASAFSIFENIFGCL